MFENLSDKLDRAFKLLKGQGYITEVNVAETLKDVRKALLDADVSYKIAKKFTEDVKDKAMGQNVLTSVSPGQLMVKIVHDELTELMGGAKVEINLKGSPPVILIAGLQGSGKTTFSAKLARYLTAKKSRKVLLVACDIYRPAAIEQLKILGQQVDVQVYAEEDSKDPVKIAKHAIQFARENDFGAVIIDTAGRLAIDHQMMDEIAAIKSTVNPAETLFVVDSMTGQDAVNTAKAFNDRLDYDGVVLTKLDGDTRGGAALTIRSVVEKPVKFVGLGEKMDALDLFHPERMADRILGMGDIVSLVEKAQEQYDVEEAQKLQRKIAKNQFDFNDFLSQIQQIKKMGNVKDLMGMIPGMGKMLKGIDVGDDAFKEIEAIISAMTPQERKDPSLLNGSRRKRIAGGSGTDVQEVNRLVKQFDDTRKMMKMMTGGSGKNMMQMMRNARNLKETDPMNPVIIDGKLIADAIKSEIVGEVKKMVEKGIRVPHLAAVLVGNDPASETYVNSKEKACKQVGIISSVYKYPDGISEETLLEVVDFLNNDEEIDGFIVQLPLPSNINENHILERILPSKDVDGFHPVNTGRMMKSIPCFLPATPMGIMTMLERAKIDTEGKHCVVLGRSNIVGTPVSVLMSRKSKPGNSTVTLCHSKSAGLEKICASADIVIAAIGQPLFVKSHMIKEGAVVIDVGIHRIPDNTSPKGYQIVGDVDFLNVAPKCSYISPVPGGVGLMTIVSLLQNTMKAAQKEIY